MSLPSDERQNPGKPGPNLILLGPPGAGKGSLATGLVSLDIEHVSSGEIFRTEIATGSQLGREFEKVLKTGSLVSDEQTLAVVRKWYFARKRNRGFLLDGFPRNLLQGKVFEEWLEQRRESLDGCLFLKISLETALLRISQRRVCPVDGSVYHLTFNPPANDEVCDKCGAKLIQREDDTEETVHHRWKVFEKETLPLISWYQKQGLLLEIDASQNLKAVQSEAMAKLSERNLI